MKVSKQAPLRGLDFAASSEPGFAHPAWGGADSVQPDAQTGGSGIGSQVRVTPRTHCCFVAVVVLDRFASRI